MNDAADSEASLLLGHYVMMKRARQLPSARLDEGRLGEDYLAALRDLHPMELTQLGREGPLQSQEPSQSVQGKQTAAAAVSVAVDQQQVPATRPQVAMEGTALQEVQPLGQPEQAYRVSLQESPVDRQGKTDGRRRT